MTTVVIVSFLTGRWTYQSGILDLSKGSPREGSLISDTDGLTAVGNRLDFKDSLELLKGSWVVEGVEGAVTMAVGDKLVFKKDTLHIERPDRTDREIALDLYLDKKPNRMHWLELREDQYTGQWVLCSLFDDLLILTIPLDGKLPPNHGASSRNNIEMVLLRRE